MKKSEEKEIIIIDGQEYELVETIPGIGFKSKEEEEEFISSLFNYDEYEYEYEYDIFNTPNMGVRA